MAATRQFRSVRYWMLYWNAGLIALCLLSFCILFRELLRVRLLELVDNHLSERTSALIKVWESIPQVAQDALREELSAGRFGSNMFIPEAAPADPPKPDDSLTGIYRPRAFTPDGRSYFRDIGDSLLDKEAFLRAVKGETVHSTVNIRGNQVRVISVPVTADGEVLFVLQSARDLREYSAQLDAVTTDLLRAIPFLLLLSAAGGLSLTNRAMRPVRQLREATQNIEARDLSQRLPVSGNDEFTLLTETLNHMLARLNDAFKQQSRFIADASHELRTPLTVLRGNTSLALSGDRSAADYRGTIERTHKSIEWMSRLVEELLLLSRADSGQMLAATERVCLNEVIRSAIEMTPGRRERPIQIVPAHEGVYVSGSEDLLVRLFANLLGNSVRHTDENAEISIALTREDGNAKVVVQDAGEGISPEHLPHVMERFYRADSARSGHAGSGLGLAICLSIVQAHHGSIDIASEAGAGATVTVRLPAIS